MDKMPQYKVTVTFDRKNPKTGALEKNSTRESVFFAPSAQIAREDYLHRLNKNEPEIMRVFKVTVDEVKDEN